MLRNASGLVYMVIDLSLSLLLSVFPPPLIQVLDMINPLEPGETKCSSFSSCRLLTGLVVWVEEVETPCACLQLFLGPACENSY